MTRNRRTTEAAQRAYDTRAESPYLITSPLDMAHKIGLWARANSVYPQEVRPGRGYKWTLNRQIVLSFADGTSPVRMT